MKEKIIVFSDHIGRIVAGTLASETAKELKVKDPVIIHVEPQPQTGQLQVHTFPYVFMEFTTPESRENNEWTFNKNVIAVSNIELDERLTTSIKNINKPADTPQIATPGAGDAKIVNLFDNE